ncbi:MAG TPA: acVLRF1 family peptidyl-tRNA hydrolase [Arthrobacter sp.]|nr:acVLRF1 family peptidyl-tRNA hydrolase [Arthrobacter sp.]
MARTKTIYLPPGRLRTWADKFAADHGGPLSAAIGPGPGSGVVLSCPDGFAVRLCMPWDQLTPELSADAWPEQLAAAAADIGTCGLILLRRGGYSVGTSEQGQLTWSKSGTRYVQSRTAAGGWSQQRYARRRSNQADALVLAATDYVVGHFPAAEPACLATGGDRDMLRQLLADGRLAGLAALPATHIELNADPRQRQLAEVARELAGIKAVISWPAAGLSGSA